MDWWKRFVVGKSTVLERILGPQVTRFTRSFVYIYRYILCNDFIINTHIYIIIHIYIYTLYMRMLTKTDTYKSYKYSFNVGAVWVFTPHICELAMLPGREAHGIASWRYKDPARIKANLWTMRTSKGCLADGLTPWEPYDERIFLGDLAFIRFDASSNRIPWSWIGMEGVELQFSSPFIPFNAIKSPPDAGKIWQCVKTLYPWWTSK